MAKNNILRFHLSYLTMLPPEKRKIIWIFISKVKINPGAKGLNAALVFCFSFATRA